MSQTACWGTNKLERCAWVSFGYGSFCDTDSFWISLEAAKAIARLDKMCYNIFGNKDISPDDYKNLPAHLRMTYSAWYIDVLGDTEESLRWWEEIELEFEKCGKYDYKTETWTEFAKKHPEEYEITQRCIMMSMRADEARSGYMTICHDETQLNICTKDSRYPNGGGPFNMFMYREDVVLTGNDDKDAIIIAKLLFKLHVQFYDVHENNAVDVETVNAFQPENGTGYFVESIEIDKDVFTVNMYSDTKSSYYVYRFDKSKDITPDWNHINEYNAELQNEEATEKLRLNNELLEWSQTWTEMSSHPKCRFNFNDNFNASLFDPEVYTPRNGFGYYRFGNPESTKYGDWYVFGGLLTRKQFVESLGRSSPQNEGRTCYICKPLHFYVIGGYTESTHC